VKGRLRFSAPTGWAWVRFPR